MSKEDQIKQLNHELSSELNRDTDKYWNVIFNEFLDPLIQDEKQQHSEKTRLDAQEIRLILLRCQLSIGHTNLRLMAVEGHYRVADMRITRKLVDVFEDVLSQPYSKENSDRTRQKLDEVLNSEDEVLIQIVFVLKMAIRTVRLQNELIKAFVKDTLGYGYTDELYSMRDLVENLLREMAIDNVKQVLPYLASLTEELVPFLKALAILKKALPQPDKNNLLAIGAADKLNFLHSSLAEFEHISQAFEQTANQMFTDFEAKTS